MRAKSGLPEFTGCESSYSDFTLCDKTGEFSKFLYERDIPCSGYWEDGSTVFHIEVKSTTGRCGEPFYMSYNQQILV